MHHWILDAELREIPVDLLTWARWVEDHNRHVGEDWIGDYRISTVFLGLDHNWTMHGPPLLYETMLFMRDEEATFGQRSLELIERYATWVEAEEGHVRAVEEIKEKLRQCGQLAGDESHVCVVPIPPRVHGPGVSGDDPAQGAD